MFVYSRPIKKVNSITCTDEACEYLMRTPQVKEKN